MAIAMIVNGIQSNKLSFQVCPDTLQNSRKAHPKAFERVHTLTCLINMHACLLGTFCNFKRERQNDLFPFEKQNVPNKHACMFIRQVRVWK